MKLSTLFLNILILFATPIMAVAPDLIPCIQDLELQFFNQALVQQALSLYQIPQGQWNPISRDLQERSLEIPDRMKQRTAMMVPNPIEFPVQRLATARILKQVLFEVFIETMRRYYVNEQPTATLIFDYILNRQAYRWLNCFGEEAKTLLPNVLD